MDVPTVENVNGHEYTCAFAVVSAIVALGTIEPTAHVLDHSPAFCVDSSGRLKAPKIIHSRVVLMRRVVRTVVYGPTGLGNDKCWGIFASQHANVGRARTEPNGRDGKAPTPCASTVVAFAREAPFRAGAILRLGGTRRLRANTLVRFGALRAMASGSTEQKVQNAKCEFGACWVEARDTA